MHDNHPENLVKMFNINVLPLYLNFYLHLMLKVLKISYNENKRFSHITQNSQNKQKNKGEKIIVKTDEV